MGRLTYKNIFGAEGSQTDQQRSDLFVVDLKIPQILNLGNGQAAGANVWQQECSFAVENFPFPERTREFTPIKFLNQTNHQIAADAASGAIDINVRYAFNRNTAQILERWNWLCSNPQTGGVAITSEVKTSGYFYWLVPNMAQQVNVEDLTATDVMLKGPAYYLEGVVVRGLKPSTADTTQNGVVTLQFSIQIDRYYPKNIGDISAFTKGSILNRLTSQ